MISRRKLPELRAFARAEATVRIKSGPEYGSLVVPNGNDSLPVHRWFKYKEAFSANLLMHLLRTADLGITRDSPIRLLDPFCGVGTSLVSAQLVGSEIGTVDAIGIECNPFSAFVARTKASWHLIDAARLRALAGSVFKNLEQRRRIQLPSLSSINSGRCITRHAARQVVLVRDHLRELSPSIERDALAVGLAGCIEAVSKVRRDGRALRLVTKTRVSLRRLLEDRWESMAEDVEALQEQHLAPPTPRVILGDGRSPLGQGIPARSIDLIVTSPPYPNNIDYNEVYKLELWLLGFVGSSASFLDLRRETFRSHPTCSPIEDESEHKARFEQILASGPLADLLGMVIRRAESLDGKCSRGRSKVLLGYLYDTWRSLAAQREVLKSGARAVYIVGNSLHGGADKPYLVPTDLVVACLAELVGFSVDQLVVARPLQRRLAGNHFLRDSVLVLKNP